MIDKLDALRDCLYRVVENGIIELRGNDLEELVDLATWAVNEIAALREARDALVADGAGNVAVPLVDDGQMHHYLTTADGKGNVTHYIDGQPADAFKGAVENAQILPYAAPPAAPEPQRDAPVRLTRAQRDALALLVMDGFYINIRGGAGIGYVTNGKGRTWQKVYRATVQALGANGHIALNGSDYSMDTYRITPQGRAALDAARDAGRDAERGTGGEG